MRKLSKLFAFLLAAVMLLSLLAACAPTINVGGDPTPTPGGSQTQNPNPGTTNNPNPSTPGTTNPPSQTVHDLYASGTKLRMAVGYNNAQTGMFFNAKIIQDLLGSHTGCCIRAFYINSPNHGAQQAKKSRRNDGNRQKRLPYKYLSE